MEKASLNCIPRCKRTELHSEMQKASISARFREPVKWRKRPCRKAFRASASRVVDEIHNTPKDTEKIFPAITVGDRDKLWYNDDKAKWQVLCKKILQVLLGDFQHD